MALTFGAVSSDRVDHGSGTSLDDLTAFTYMLWVYITTNNNGRTFCAKGNSKVLKLSGTGNIDLRVPRVTTAAQFVTNDGPITVNTWHLIAATYDVGAGAGEVINIYTGTLSTTVAERAYGTSTDGAGATNADNTTNFFVGNNSNINAALVGRVAWAGVWNRVLTLPEIKAQQFHLHPTSGCVLFCHEGWNGAAGVQADWSGRLNNGSPTGVTLSNHVPIGPMIYGSDTLEIIPAIVTPTGLPPSTLLALTGVGH